MPGTRCTVAICNNSLVKTKESSKNIMYHRFPKNSKIRKEWVHKTRRGGKWNPDTACICSEHFTDDDYIRDLKAELLNIPVKPKLKPTAVPSLKLSTKCEEERSQGIKKRHDKAVVHELLNASSSSNSCSNIANIPGVQENNQVLIEQDDSESLEKKYDALLIKYIELQENFNKILTTVNEQKQIIRSIEKQLKEKSGQSKQSKSKRVVKRCRK